jgi:hypothetical protein
MPKKKGDFNNHFSKEQYAMMETMAAYGAPMHEIADELEIDERTLERRMKEDPLINAAIKRGRRKAHMKARKTLYDMAFVDKSVQAAIFYARTRLGWKEPKQEIEVTAVGNVAPTIKFNFGKDGAAIEQAKEQYLDQQPVKSDETE